MSAVIRDEESPKEIKGFYKHNSLRMKLHGTFTDIVNKADSNPLLSNVAIYLFGRALQRQHHRTQ